MIVPGKLVHDTGTMIRFRTSQLGQLPTSSKDVQVLLPNDQLVRGHFNRHPQNPNVSGAELVRFIKRRMSFGKREDILVDVQSDGIWVVHTVADAVAIAEAARVPVGRLRSGKLTLGDFSALVALADREADRGRRIATYRRVLRPSGLRRLVLALLGGRCMVGDCGACDQFDLAWGAGSGEFIVEVHHVELIARSIDHHPRNLCVLCANHHRFVHNSGAWTIVHDGGNLLLRRGRRELLVRRSETLFT